MKTIIIALALSILFMGVLFKLNRFCKERVAQKVKRNLNFNSAKECLAFFKVKVPEGCVIYHKNKDKKDNRFINLEVITRNELLNRIRKVK